MEKDKEIEILKARILRLEQRLRLGELSAFRRRCQKAEEDLEEEKMKNRRLFNKLKKYQLKNSKKQNFINKNNIKKLYHESI